MSGYDELIAAAKQRAEASLLPDDWGYRIALEPGESFVGRYRGETIDEQNENRRVFLFWDSNDQPCFSRTYAALAREIDRAAPQLGETVAVVRGDDYASQQGTGYAYGVETEPSDAPVPEADALDSGGLSLDDDVPFL